ncbi:Uncharacterized protein APZ42_029371 [Daphnia magna]|uniref:Uncharacterized protein n=1 Tax=Daphnia magna TaxID=35525 RepID=A0A164PHI1_9CRUS|nr:Uncharacterized protein APZ42_029371 [Daphnia magna]
MKMLTTFDKNWRMILHFDTHVGILHDIQASFQRKQQHRFLLQRRNTNAQWKRRGQHEF